MMKPPARRAQSAHSTSAHASRPPRRTRSGPAPRFSLTDVAVGYAVARGQKVAREKGYVMVEG